MDMRLSSTSVSDLASDEFFHENPRISNLVARYSYYVQDIMQIKLAATQLVHNVLDESIRICMVFYGKDPPLPSRLLVYDPSNSKDRDLYEDFGFDVTIRQKIEALIAKFIKQWVHKRRHLKYCLQLYRHWTTNKPRLLPLRKNTAGQRIIRYADEDDLDEADDANVDEVGMAANTTGKAAVAVARKDKIVVDNPVPMLSVPCPPPTQENMDYIIEHTFVYEAKFSAPTRQCPTPQCTASVFFWLQVDEFDWFIQRHAIYESYRYQFEGRVYMHKPSVHGHPYDFQEGILLEILEEKYKLYDSLDF